jgi:putative oxidoreductase
MNDLDAVNLALLLLRVAAGATLAAHGYNHIFGGGRIEGTGRWFASMGMRPGIVHAWVASLTELAAGALLVLGLLTPLGAAGLVGIMVVAGITAHRTNGFFIFKPGQGWEYVMILAVVGIALGALGAGGWSLDAALDIRWSAATGLATAAVLGIGGAAALLAVAWRPPAGDVADP